MVASFKSAGHLGKAVALDLKVDRTALKHHPLRSTTVRWSPGHAGIHGMLESDGLPSGCLARALSCVCGSASC